MTHRCDICGQRMPYQRIGRPRARHQGACEREERRRYQAQYIHVAAPARSVVQADVTVRKDLSADEIEARFASALLEVKRRRMFTTDPWQQRGVR